jgi:hypothetical protein
MYTLTPRCNDVLPACISADKAGTCTWYLELYTPVLSASFYRAVYENMMTRCTTHPGQPAAPGADACCGRMPPSSG